MIDAIQGRLDSSHTTGLLRRATCLAAAALFVTTLGGTAEAQEKRVSVRNQTQHTMVGFYARASGKRWSSNALGNSAIRSGSAVTINLGSGRPCQYDVRVEFDTGGGQTTRGVNLCKVGSLRYK